MGWNEDNLVLVAGIILIILLGLGAMRANSMDVPYLDSKDYTHETYKV